MEEDHLFELNYSITLFNNDEIDKARDHFAEFEKLWGRLDDDTKNSDPEVIEQQNALRAALAS
jgi:Bardet-Biedl syndrome 4 protein